MGLLAETLVTSIAFEAQMDGVEIARQGLLNLTRDINKVAYSFTNAFEGIANKLLGLAGPGMFSSITVAGTLLPHQKAVQQFELATGHMADGVREDLEQFRDELGKTNDFSGKRIAEMQRAFAQANLEVPEGEGQANFLNALTEQSLHLTEALDLTDSAGNKLMATLTGIENRGGRAMGTDQIADLLAFAGTRGGWSADELMAMVASREGQSADTLVPLQTIIAAGTAASAAGVSRSDTAGFADRMYKKLRELESDNRHTAMNDIRQSTGMAAGGLMGSLGTGNLGAVMDALEQARAKGVDLRDLGDGLLFTDEDAQIAEALMEHTSDIFDIMRAMEDPAEGVSGSLKRAFEQSENAQSLATALRQTYTALENTFTKMADSGVLNALTSFMGAIESLVSWFNNLPGPMHDAIGLLIHINIWFSIITSTLTILMGAMLFFIMYLWGMWSVIGWVIKGIRLLTIAMGWMGKSTIVVGAIFKGAAASIDAFSARVVVASARMRTFGLVGQAVSFIMMRFVTILNFAALTMRVAGGTAAATGWGMRILAWSIRGAIAALSFLAKAWAFQIGMMRRAVVWTWANVIAKGALAAASIAMGIASFFASTGIAAITIAGAPLWAIILAIIAAVALLIAGWYAMTYHTDKVIAVLEVMRTWFKRLVLAALIAGAVIAAPFVLMGAAILWVLEKLGILTGALDKAKGAVSWLWGGDGDGDDKAQKDEPDNPVAAENKKQGPGFMRKVGEATGFVAPRFEDMQMPTGGLGPTDNMGFSTEPIARARQPGMNLPVGGDSASRGGPRTVSYHADIKVEVNVPEGTPAQDIGQIVADAIDKKWEERIREAQTNLTGGVIA